MISNREGFFSRIRRFRLIKFEGAILTISLFFREKKATSLPEKKEDAIIRRMNRMPYVIIVIINQIIKISTYLTLHPAVQ